MANIGSFKQQPAEVLDYDIDFSEWIPEGDTITAAALTVEPTGPVVTYAISSPRVKVWFYDGTNGTTYKITVQATTNDNRVKEVEFKIKVKDD